jgi:hypothetical protein
MVRAECASVAVHEAVRCHGGVEPIRYVGRLTTCVVRREERSHEQPHGNYAYGDGCRHKSHIEAAAFHDLLFGSNCRRDGRLAVRVRLGRRCGCELAIGLIQVSDELNGFRCCAANHDPERKIYFQRDRHRVSPLFDFRGLEATKAPQGTKVPTNESAAS